jgi:hypothetical protein
MTRNEGVEMTDINREDREFADQIRAIANRSDKLTHRARCVEAQLSDAGTMRRGALLEAGGLVGAVKALKAEHGSDVGIDIVRLAELTGLSRPTLDKWAAAVQAATSTDLRNVSNAELAQMHAGYGYGGHEEIDAEFWARNPHLAGWHHAYTWLVEQAHNEWVKEHGDPMTWLDAPVPQAAEDLHREYRRTVDAIAAG